MPLCMNKELAVIVVTALSELSPMVDYKVFVPEMDKGVIPRGSWPMWSSQLH